MDVPFAFMDIGLKKEKDKIELPSLRTNPKPNLSISMLRTLVGNKKI